jgi:hypothetical protein
MIKVHFSSSSSNAEDMVIRSNLNIKSNLEVVTASKPINDPDFLKKINNIDALRYIQKLKKEHHINDLMYCPTSSQTELFGVINATNGCPLRKKNIYPWGTVMKGGKRKLVCQCDQTECCYYKSICGPHKLPEFVHSEQNKLKWREERYAFEILEWMNKQVPNKSDAGEIWKEWNIFKREKYHHFCQQLCSNSLSIEEIPNIAGRLCGKHINIQTIQKFLPAITEIIQSGGLDNSHIQEKLGDMIHFEEIRQSFYFQVQKIWKDLSARTVNFLDRATDGSVECECGNLLELYEKADHLSEQYHIDQQNGIKSLKELQKAKEDCIVYERSISVLKELWESWNQQDKQGHGQCEENDQTIVPDILPQGDAEDFTKGISVQEPKTDSTIKEPIYRDITGDSGYSQVEKTDVTPAQVVDAAEEICKSMFEQASENKKFFTRESSNLAHIFTAVDTFKRKLKDGENLENTVDLSEELHAIQKRLLISTEQYREQIEKNYRDFNDRVIKNKALLSVPIQAGSVSAEPGTQIAFSVKEEKSEKQAQPSLPEIKDAGKSIPIISDNPDNRGQHNEKVYTLPVPVKKSTFSDFKYISQEEYIKDRPDKRTMVNAGPGTGKTWALIQKISYMMGEKPYGIPADRILILCYSRAAVAVIRSRLAEKCPGLPWKDIAVGTMDSFAGSICYTVDQEENNASSIYHQFQDGDYDETIKRANDILIDSHGQKLLSNYQFLAVDEIQDINGIRADFLMTMLKNINSKAGVTLLGDRCQSIFDFQNKKDHSSSTTSGKLFQYLCSDKSVVKVSFRGNHRSSFIFNSQLDIMRSELMSDNLSQIESMMTQVKNQLPELKIGGRKLFVKLPGTTGILVRSNREALQIAQKLQCQGIDIFLQKRRDTADLSGWIGRFFRNYKSRMIYKDVFIHHFQQVFPDDICHIMRIEPQPELYWNALLTCVDQATGRQRTGQYQVRDILYSVYCAGWSMREECGLLFNGLTSRSEVTVSNIHQAKGREYDNVYVHDTLFTPENWDKRSAEDFMEEFRIAYVGLTRGKKEIQVFHSSLQSGRQLDDQRCYTIVPGINKRPRVFGIEFGLYGDLDRESFGGKDIQDYLYNYIPIGKDIILDKEGISSDKMGYEVEILDKNAPLMGGKVSRQFVHGWEAALCHNSRVSGMVIHPEQYPKKFTDLYIDDLVTYLCDSIINKPGVKCISDMSVWNGISVIGIAKSQW